MAIKFEELVSKVIERTDPSPVPDVDKFAGLVSDALLVTCCTCPGVYAEVWNSIRDRIQSGDLFGTTFASAVAILRQIQGAVAAYSDAEPIELAKTVKVYADTLLTTFQKKLGPGGAAIPEVLRTGPEAALQSLQGLFDLLGQLGRLQGIDDRITLVKRSLNELLAPGGGGTPFRTDQFLGDFLNKLLNLPKAVRDGGDPAALVDDVLRSGLVYPQKSITDALDFARQQQLWAWTQLPASLTPGRLGTWLNSDATYLNGPGTGRLHLLERQFRTRLIAAVDAYFLEKTPDVRVPSALTGADERNGADSAADLVCLFFDTVMHFILEPDCYPTADPEWESIEDVGYRYAGLAARQVRAPIRAAVGLLIRGTGFWPVGNNVVVETIGAVLSSAFSAILEGVVRNMTWTLRVYSCYQGAPVDDGAVVVHRWPSLETINNTTTPGDRLEFVALVRPLVPGGAVPAVRALPVVQRLLEDFGAYLDTCYRSYLRESRFPKIGKLTDTVKVFRADLVDGDLLFVEAKTDKVSESPRPVLRVYFCCHVAAMNPGSDNDPALYVLKLRLGVVPRRCPQVVVLSNRGGEGQWPPPA